MDGYEALAAITAAEESARSGTFVTCDRRIPADC
jgi:hypothetical protein